MKLSDQVNRLHIKKDILEAGINSIQRYLNSEKYSIDISANKNDILMRINELAQELADFEASDY